MIIVGIGLQFNFFILWCQVSASRAQYVEWISKMQSMLASKITIARKCIEKLVSSAYDAVVSNPVC